MVEIYSKNQYDSDFNPSVMDIQDRTAMYLNQIRNLLSAEVGAILGAPEMSANIEEMIFETNIDASKLSKDIENQIIQYCTLARYYKTKVEAKFALGKTREICFIDIIVDDVKRLQVRIT